MKTLIISLYIFTGFALPVRSLHGQSPSIEISSELQALANEFADETTFNLTENDRVALKLLGYSDKEIDEMTLGAVLDKEGRDKLKNRLKGYADKKAGEIEQGVTSSLVPGLASSVTGLAFASLLGLVVGFKCHSMPSGISFAATSGAWVALEMMIWKGFQINMKDINSLQNATNIPAKVEKKAKRVRKIIEDLERDFAASNQVAYEQFLEDKKPELDEIRAIANELRAFLRRSADEQFGAMRGIQESLALAAETSRKKSRNATVAAAGFTAAAGLAAAEAANILSVSGACFSERKMPLLWDVIPSAYAGFANVGDLDKIGIPLGAGLAAAYLKFEASFADKIFANGSSRAIVFLSMAGIAALAAVKLKEAAKFLDKQAQEIDIFVTSLEARFDDPNTSFPDDAEMIRRVKERLLPSLEDLANELAASEEGQELIDKAKEKIGELQTLNESEIQEILQAEAGESAGDILNSINKFESDSSFREVSGDEFIGRLETSFIDYLISDAFAGALRVRPSCFGRTRNYLVEVPTCSCAKKGTCHKSGFPEKIPMNKKSEFGALVIGSSLLASRSSDFIFWGQPKKGLSGFNKLHKKTSLIRKNTQRVVSTQVKRNIDDTLIASLVNKAREMTYPAIKEGRVLGAGKIHPRILNKKSKKGLAKLPKPPKNMRMLELRKGLQKKLVALKKSGNSSLKGFEQKESAHPGYIYDENSINKDSTKNLFNIIKRRYIEVIKSGRL